MNLAVSGGTVSIDKTNWIQATTYTIQAGQSDGALYFRANSQTGTGTVTLSYSENATNWTSSTQTIQIIEPYLSFINDPLLTKVNTPSDVAKPYQLSLKDTTKYNTYTSV